MNNNHFRKSSTERKHTQIIKMPKRFRMNIGIMIFLVILIYLIFSVVQFVRKDKTLTYQVQLPEKISSEETYDALILRQESVATSPSAGYVNFYIQEGGRAGLASAVVSVDETGDVSSKLKTQLEGQTLSDDQVKRVKQKLVQMTVNCNSQNYSSVYNGKYEVQSEVQSGMSEILAKALSENNAESTVFHIYKADTAGIVSYSQDGYEDCSWQDVTAEWFDKTNYKKNRIGDMVEKDGFLFKVITSENWSLVFPVSEEAAARFNKDHTVKITFLENNLEADASAEVFTGADGALYARIDLSQYMIRFALNRFTQIRVSYNEAEGYKIPRSSVITKDYFVVPKQYAYRDGNGSSLVLMKETYSAEGSVTENISPALYNLSDEYYYVDPDEVPEGTVLAMPDSDERYTVRNTGVVSGVMNVNRGYAVFRIINIIDENEEYYIAEKGLSYSVSAYDYILLHASSASEGDIVN